MAKIFYSMAGEGRGHAARVRAMSEALRGQHELHLFAPGDAFEFLDPLYRGTEIRVHSIPGMRFSYRGDSLDYIQTARRNLAYLTRLPKLVRSLCDVIEKESPDLCITDFEPALPRAARRAGVPFLSLNHQHFLLANELSALPARLRAWARFMGVFVGGFYRGQCATIVSSFYAPPLKRRLRDTHQVGVLLRPELRAAVPEQGSHLLAYVRRALPARVIEGLVQSGREARVYGLGERASVGRVRFRPISESGFLEDLATCAGVLSTAGNQLVGEALHLEKPVLAIPEPGNAEQEINGHFLTESGAGLSVRASEFSPRSIHQFLDSIEGHRRFARAGRWDGTSSALGLIERYLGGSERPYRQPELTTTTRPQNLSVSA